MSIDDYRFGDSLLVEFDGGVRIVTLNRPEAMNAFDDELHASFSRLWSIIDHDDEARAVVLTGAGKAFSAGGDLDEFERYRVDLRARNRAMATGRRLVSQMIDVSVPVVAAVNGPGSVSDARSRRCATSCSSLITRSWPTRMWPWRWWPAMVGR